MSSACSQAIGAPAVGPCHVARHGSCTSTSSIDGRSRSGAFLSAWLPRGGCIAAAGSPVPSHVHCSSLALTCPRFLAGRCSSGSGSSMLVRRSELRSATWRPNQSTRGRKKRSMGGNVEMSAYSKSDDSTNAAVAVGRRMRGGESGTVFVSASSGSESRARNGVTSTTTSVATPAGGSVPSTTSSPYPGSPLLWVGVGVAISVIFHRIAKEVEKRSAELQRAAMQQILKSMTGGPPGTSAPPFGMPPFPMPPSSPLGTPPPAFTPPASFPPPPTYTTESSPSSTTSTAGADDSSVSAQAHEASPVAAVQRKPAFTDVSPDAMGWEGGSKPAEEGKGPFFHDAEVVDSNASSSGTGSSQTGGGAAAGAKESVFTVEALEKMMEDPMVQKMVYPYLPEEMRNPATFKWMLQNPQYRQQLQEMLGNMGGDAAWDGRMADMMKNFNLSSNEVKQQFDQIGMKPEDVISKIMANPDIAVAFQSPKVQAAIMDCSQNPLNISKYQNDREVMDVFSRISELFPGMT